jgi:hypothetical protein
MKIDPAELRIGNWVTDKKSTRPFQVMKIDDETIELCQKGFIKGIPISHDVLTECGFQRFLDYKIWNKQGPVEWMEAQVEDHRCGHWIYFIAHCPIRIKYLHDLQNAWKMTTREELEWKKEKPESK